MEDMETKTENKTEETKEENIQETVEKLRKSAQEAQEAMVAGKGILKLETPIRAGGEDIAELPYDFTQVTGTEYAESMDADTANTQIFRITYKQSLHLFAIAAAKQVKKADKTDILERIGIADAIKGSQLAMLFFSTSTRAGNMRISKK